VLGQVTINVNLGGLIVPFGFRVVDKLNQDMILGIDFLEHTKAKIICAEHKVIFYDDLVQMNFVEKQKDIIASLDENCILHPGTETLVKVYLSESMVGKCVMLEPMAVRDKQKYLIAREVIQPNGKYSVCKILNASDQKISLRRHLQVAKVQGIDVNSITVYEDEENKGSKAKESRGNVRSSRTLKELGIEINNENLTQEQRGT